jgi:hypothetical protein
MKVDVDESEVCRAVAYCVLSCVCLTAPHAAGQIKAVRDEIDVLKKVRNANIVTYFGCWGPDASGALCPPARNPRHRQRA